MGTIRKIKEDELIGGSTNNDVYPVTSSMAVYDTQGSLLEYYLQHIKKTHTYAGVASLDTNPGSYTHPAFYILRSVGTYKYFKSFDNPSGFLEVSDTGLYIATNSYTSLNNWSLTSILSIAQSSGNSESMPISQKAVTEIINNINNTFVAELNNNNEELIRRIQGVSNNTEPYYDPFMLVKFESDETGDSWTKFIKWLDSLHTTNGEIDTKKAGYFRASLSGIYYDVRNNVNSWSNNSFTQVISGNAIADKSALNISTTYNIVQRNYSSGSWSSWENIFLSEKDTLTNWKATNPVLGEGSMALVASSDSKPTVYDSKKIGDGTSKFSELPFDISSIPTIDFHKLDDMFSLESGTEGFYNVRNILNAKFPVFYRVVDNGAVVGTLQIMSQWTFYSITQIFTTHYADTGFSSVTDKYLYTYYRSFNVNSRFLEVPQGEWSPWQKLYLTNEDKSVIDEAINDHEVRLHDIEVIIGDPSTPEGTLKNLEERLKKVEESLTLIKV